VGPGAILDTVAKEKSLPQSETIINFFHYCGNSSLFQIDRIRFRVARSNSLPAAWIKLIRM
jgi:hypothetical protein